MPDKQLLPLGYCPDHGIVAVPGIFSYAPGAQANFIIEGSTAECPRCHRVIELLPAAYNLLENSLNVLIFPTISKDALSALRDLALSAQRGDISPQEAADKAAKIDPKHGEVFSKFLTRGIAAAGLLASIYSCHLSAEGNKSSSEVGMQIVEVLKEQKNQLAEISDKLEKLDKADIQTGSAEPAKPEIEPSRAIPKNKPKRRSEVKKKRRDDLKRWRMQFTPRPKPKPKKP